MRRVGSVQVLHLRLRSACRATLRLRCSTASRCARGCCKKIVRWALSRARPKESRAFPLTMTYMEVAYPEITALPGLLPVCRLHTRNPEIWLRSVEMRLGDLP